MCSLLDKVHGLAGYGLSSQSPGSPSSLYAGRGSAYRPRARNRGGPRAFPGGRFSIVSHCHRFSPVPAGCRESWSGTPF